MSLYDLMTCKLCTHERYMHDLVATVDVLGNATDFHGRCGEDGCPCRGFLEPRPGRGEPRTW